MSFILDALKKAESERLLGDLPGIHTQQAIQPSQSGALGRRWRPGLLALCLVVAILCVLAWQAIAMRGQLITLPVAPPTMPVTAIVTPAVVGTGSLRDAPTPPQAQRSVPIATEILVPPAIPKPVVFEKKEAPPKLRAKNMPVSVSVVTVANVIGMAELPPAIQRQLPPLAISGSMYSANPVDRMLLVDKRMLHEGDEVVAGLVLETILQKSAILRYKGYRFQISR